MTFPQKDSLGNRITACSQPVETGYSNEDITKVNNVFRICEDIYLEYPITDPLHVAILANLAHEGCGIRSDDDVVEIYEYVEDTVGFLPPNRGEVMSTIEHFTTNLPARSLSRSGGLWGLGQSGAGVWDDALNFSGTFLTGIQDVLRGVIPAQSHAAGCLSNLWENPPGHVITDTSVSVRPPSVTDTSCREARRTLTQNYHRSTDTLNGLTKLARYTFIVTKINTIWQFGHSLFNFHGSSARWRTTLQAFHDNPTPENLAAYGIAAGSMVNDIQGMVNNLPVSPTGSIPFYGSIFNDAGSMATRLVSLLGSHLYRTDAVIREGEVERDGPHQERGD